VFSAGLVALDLQSSWAESRILPIIDRRVTFSIKPRASQQTSRPKTGPYDERPGYSQNPELTGKLRNAGLAEALGKYIEPAVRVQREGVHKYFGGIVFL
jgi:hypothetical protein